MKIRFFTGFSKRENSTKQPPATAGSYTEYECYMKEDTSIVNPTVILDNSFTLFSANYAYIPDTGRYYFVSDIVAIGKLWSVSLKCDVLATYKTTIGASSEYIIRAAGAYDSAVPDNYYPAKSSHTNYADSVNSPFIASGQSGIRLQDGCFIVGIVNNDNINRSNRYGSVMYYVFDRPSMAYFVYHVLLDGVSNDNGFSTTDASFALQRSIINPLDWIRSCIWLPVPADTFGGTGVIPAGRIYISDWHVDMPEGYTVWLMTKNPPVINYSASITMRKHPQAATRGSWLNGAPWTQISVNVPPFGNIEIDPITVSDVSTITAAYALDVITGICVLELKRGSYIINRLNSMVGVQIQLSQIMRDYAGGLLGGLASIAGGLGSLATGNAAGAFSSGMSLIGNALDMFKPRSQSLGGNGSFAELNEQITANFQFMTAADDDNTHNGRPLMAVRQISTLSGYMLCEHGDIEISGYDNERKQVAEYLTGGFFYE